MYRIGLIYSCIIIFIGNVLFSTFFQTTFLEYSLLSLTDQIVSCEEKKPKVVYLFVKSLPAFFFFPSPDQSMVSDLLPVCSCDWR